MIAYAFLALDLFTMIVLELGRKYSEIFWNIAGVLLASALCFALNRISNFTRSLASTGIVSNERLIKIHLSSFMVGTFLNIVTFFLQVVIKESSDLSEETE